MFEDHKLLLKRIGLVGFSQTYTNLKGLFLLPVLTRSLDTSEYGVYSLILISVAILQPFILLGLQDAVLRFLAPQSKEKIVQGVITVTIVVLCSGTIASIIFFFSSDFLANIILKDPSVAYIIKIAAPFIILDSMNTIILSSFRVFGMIKKYAAVLIMKTTLEMGLIYFFILSGFGLIGAIISLIIASIISLIIMLYFIFSYAGISRPNFVLIKPYLSFGLPLIPMLSAIFICDINDRYVIGFFLGAEKVGIYSAAYGIGTIPLVLSRYVLFVLGPTVFNLYDAGKVDKVKMYLSYSWKYLSMLSIPSAFGLSILARPLLLSMTTSKFVSDGIYIIPFVVVGIVFWGMEQIFAISLYLFKRRKIFVIAFICGAGTNFVLNIMLIPKYGLISAAITTLIAYFLILIIIGYSSRCYFRFDLNFRFIGKCFFAATGMTFFIWIFNPNSVVGIVVSIIIGIIIYFCLLIFQRGFTREELRTIFEIFGFKKFYEKIVRTYDHIRK
jgi:O-antigen/teichoic acid export membrane protein